MLFALLGMLYIDREALENEWFCVINALLVLRHFFSIIVYCVSTLSLHIESTMILKYSATESYKLYVCFVDKQ